MKWNVEMNGNDDMENKAKRAKRDAVVIQKEEWAFQNIYYIQYMTLHRSNAIKMCVVLYFMMIKNESRG